jgi:hypothetical protein
MDLTEQLIRDGLGHRNRDMLESYMKRHPEINGYLKKASNAYVSGVVDSFVKAAASGEALDKEEIREARKEIKTLFKPFLGLISDAFSYEKMLGSADKAYSKSAEMDAENRKDFYEKFTKDVEARKLPNGVVSMDKVAIIARESEVTKTNDKLVAKLKDVATKKGIEYALTNRSVYKATREIFPTRDEYANFSEANLKDVRERLSVLDNIIDLRKMVGSKSTVEDEETADAGNKVINSLISGVGEYIKVWEKVSKGKDEELMDKLYPIKKPKS